MRIEEIKNSDLDVLDMTKIADFIKSEEHKNYFLEHLFIIFFFVGFLIHSLITFLILSHDSLI